MEKPYQRIALIGLDGSGKSTNIEKMKADRSFASYHFVWIRWEPTLLKLAYWLLNRKIAADESQPNRHENASSSNRKKQQDDFHKKNHLKKKLFRHSFVRSCWMAAVLVDYFSQFYLKTLGLLLGKRSIIFDRFFIDLFIDQGINFGYSSSLIEQNINSFQRLFPRVDRFIYIRVSPETCYLRKNDIPSIEYLLHRYCIYELLSRQSNWVTIDGERSLEEVNEDIKKLVLS